jgi:hypothetical protein
VIWCFSKNEIVLSNGVVSEDHRQLLERFRPSMRYDSLETYFADSAEEWTANPGNALYRKDRKPIELRAASRLSLELLGEDVYSDGTKVEAGDYIEATDDDYGDQYLALRQAHPEFRNVIYGHAVQARGQLWLQYWFFYFLNDYQLDFGFFDVHEGDWEMIQLLMAADGSEPERAVYAQHDFCEVRPWPEVEKLPEDGDRPLVYVGRGSHASFFSAGYHPTAFYDVTDGKRRPKVEPRLEIVPDQAPPWLLWPGSWGGSRAGAKGPGGPGAHAQWEDPVRLLEKKAVIPDNPPKPDEPRLWARRRRGRLLLDFDFTAMPAPPKRLVATVNSIDERNVPPHSFRFGLREVVLGSLQTRVELDAKKHYDIALAVIDARDRPTIAETFVIGPKNTWRGLRDSVGAALGRAVHLARLLFKGGD